MASFGGVYFFACLFLGSFLVAEAQVDNASLIERLCNKTDYNFLFCMECLTRKAQNGEDEDMKALGGKSIRCAHRSTLVARQSMLEISKNSTGKIQQQAKFCVSKLDSAAACFSSALKFWTYLHKSDALDLIQEAAKDYHNCVQDLHDQSDELVHQLNCVRARSEAASSVIKAIPV